jgi:transposase
MTYSLDMRQQVLKIRSEEGLSMAEVGKRFGVGVASVMRWSKNIEAIKKRNRSTKIDMEALKRDVEQYPDAYQHERAARLSVSDYCVWYALKRLGVTYKKNTSASKGNSRKTLCFLRRDKETQGPRPFISIY